MKSFAWVGHCIIFIDEKIPVILTAGILSTTMVKQSVQAKARMTANCFWLLTRENLLIPERHRLLPMLLQVAGETRVALTMRSAMSWSLMRHRPMIRLYLYFYLPLPVILIPMVKLTQSNLHFPRISTTICLMIASLPMVTDGM